MKFYHIILSVLSYQISICNYIIQRRHNLLGSFLKVIKNFLCPQSQILRTPLWCRPIMRRVWIGTLSSINIHRWSISVFLTREASAVFTKPWTLLWQIHLMWKLIEGFSWASSYVLTQVNSVAMNINCQIEAWRWCWNKCWQSKASNIQKWHKYISNLFP